MRILYVGTGSVYVEGVGEVVSGGTCEVNKAQGEALVSERPKEWKVAAKGKAESAKK